MVGGRVTKEMRLLEVKDMFIILNVMMGSQMHSSYPDVHFKYVQFTACQFYLKAVKKIISPFIFLDKNVLFSTPF